MRVYHLVCVAKYRRVVFDAAVEAALRWRRRCGGGGAAVEAARREVCLEIALRFEITFLEIGTDGDHVHFLLQSVPT